MAHGLGAVKEMRLDAYAERFVAEGYRVLVFDYRHFGASEGEPRGLLDIQRQLDDWAAAMHHVRSLPQVDRRRIVLWGSSFGGGHVIEAASRDGDVAAIISQCPFTDGFASLRTLGVRSLVKVTILGVRDALRGFRGRRPVRVALVGRRGEAALMTTPDAKPGYEALIPAGCDHPGKVAARVALRIPFYYPGRAAASLECPALFCVAMKDTVAPSRSTIWHVRKARQGRIKRYRTGHFDLYLEPWFDEVVTDQIEFLRSAVPVSS
jgi:pimeloyl-ACP methyl ester carboxylesterase